MITSCHGRSVRLDIDTMQPILLTPTTDHSLLDAVADILRSRLELPTPRIVTWDDFERTREISHSSLTILFVPSDRPDRIHGIIPQCRELKEGLLFVLGPAHDPKFILKAIQSGADTYLDEADLPDELNQAIDRFHAKRPHATPVCRLIAVLPASGGCGVSTIAVNLAVLLAKHTGQCHVIDLNPGKGDLSPLLDVKPQYTMTDLSRNEGRLDRTMYAKLLTNHTSGISLLAAPQSFDEINHCSTDSVALALSIARESFPEIVVDLEDCFHDEQFLALQKATKIVLVARPDFTSIRNARNTLDRLTANGIARDRIVVVLNQVGRPGELPHDEIETALGSPVAHTIAYDPERCCGANNTGIPIALHEPTAPFCRSLAKLFDLPVAPESGPSLFRRVLSRLWKTKATRIPSTRSQAGTRAVRPLEPSTAPPLLDLVNGNYEPSASTKCRADVSRTHAA